MLARLIWKRQVVSKDRKAEVFSLDSDKFHTDFHFKQEHKKESCTNIWDQWMSDSFGSFIDRLTHTKKKSNSNHLNLL